MGKRTGIILFILVSTFNMFAQTCNPNMVKVNIDSTGCETIELGTMRFSVLFYAEKHLAEIQDSIPTLKEKHREERKDTKKIEENLQAEIDSTEAINTILVMGRKEALNTVAELEVANLRLKDDLEDWTNHKRWLYLGGGVVSTFLVKPILNGIKEIFKKED